MSALHRLSREMGIVDEYVDQSGKEHRQTTDETRVALLASMGVDARDDRACLDALAALEAEREARPIAPVVVTSDRRAPLAVMAPEARRWRLVVREEGAAEARTLQGQGSPRAIALPALPLGYHDLELTLDDAPKVTQRRIVTPERCPDVRACLARDRAFGIAAQLYAVRSARNWGVGDLRDLALLVRRAASWGAAFVGLNPLHALENEGRAISPYSPISRLFRNWIYLDVEAVPELAGEVPPDLASLRAAPRVDYAAVASLKRSALQRAHALFLARPADDPRRAAFDAYVRAEGDDLRDFATFCATTPAERSAVPHARAPGVEALREKHLEAIAFHAFLQFELDRQLAEVARVGREAGLGLGLYQDLAIGCAPDGSDRWADPALFASGVSIGAPPDEYSSEGQNWGLPPMNPHHLARALYRPWITLLRHALAHSGALRMDHVIGLFRQFWIPDGRSGKEGAYVRFPAEDLLGIAALEATRARAIVVGEDLGTVPPEVPEVLARFGVLSSRVLYFEMEDGAFKPPGEYSERALTTANTHDMAPLAGWWVAKDAELKERAGLIDAGAAADARVVREKDRTALVDRLRQEGLLQGDPARCDAATIAAIHTFLARTPSALVGLSLDDVLEETEPVNVPGATPERHPSWQRKYRVPVEQLSEQPATIPLNFLRFFAAK